MAQFEAKRLDESKINGGNRYNVGDGVSEEAINAPIEGVLYAQNFLDAALEKSQVALDGVSELKEKQSEQDKQIEENSQNTKLLYNIVEQKGFIRTAEIEQAYTTRETAAGQNIVDEQYTDVLEIKGSTVSCKNLIPYPYYNKTLKTNGVTITDNGDGTLTLNGTATKDIVLKLFESVNIIKGSYVFSGCPKNGSMQTYYLQLRTSKDNAIVADFHDLGNGVIVNIEEDLQFFVWLRIKNGTNVRGLTFKPMLNEGSTALPFRPYFSGLKNAYLQSVKSTGRNLFDISKVVNGTWKDSVAVSGQSVVFTYAETSGFDLFAFAYWIDIPKNTDFVCQCDSTSITAYFAYTDRLFGNMVGDRVWLGEKLNSGDNTRLLVGFYSVGSKRTGTSEIISNIRINIGSTAQPYEPYTEDIYQLPETLELKEFDSFNPQTGEVVRATKEIVITGEEPRWHLSDAGTNLARFGHDGLASGAVGGSYRISNKDVFGVTQIEVYSSGWVDIYDTRYKSVEEWTNYLKSLNAAGTPLRIAYKLETPTTETIANVPKSYKAHNHGSETVNQGTTDNSRFGAMPTITNEYMIIL